MEPPTLRQKQILEFINMFIFDNEYSPTQREITEEFGFKSGKATQDHLAAMKRKGLVDFETGKSRTIRPL